MKWKRNRLIILFMILSILLMVISTSIIFPTVKAQDNRKAISSEDFLIANGKNLRKNYGEGDIVQLKGTNIGGWLNQELWMTITQETDHVKAEKDIYDVLTNRFGEEKMWELINTYQDAYWTENDFKNCYEMGINCIRLPFWYRNLVDENGEFYGYQENAQDPYVTAFKRLDWFINTAGSYGIYVILDFHGAPGSQSGSDHSGVDGRNQKEASSEFFFGENALNNQQLFQRIWYVIAQRYAGNATVAGYDILNEAYSSYRYKSSHSDKELLGNLWNIYNNAYETIRKADPNHVIIMEAIWDPSDLPDPDLYNWKNVMYEYHQYTSEDSNNDQGKQTYGLQNKIKLIQNANYNIPSYMGEFTLKDNLNAWDTGLKMLNESGINWSIWSYKTTTDCGNWGLYYNLEFLFRVNIETDSFSKIKSCWGKTGISISNTRLIDVIKRNI